MIARINSTNLVRGVAMIYGFFVSYIHSSVYKASLNVGLCTCIYKDSKY